MRQSGHVGNDDGWGHAAHDHSHQVLQRHGYGHANRWQAPVLKQRLSAAFKLSHGVVSFVRSVLSIARLYC